jgi:hypothetical protein
MADIKTRDAVKGTIKQIDKAAIAADRMRVAFVQTKEKAEHSTHASENSTEEYAADRFEGGVDRVTHEAAHQFDKQGRKGVEATKENYHKTKDGIRQFKEKRSEQAINCQRTEAQTSARRTAHNFRQSSIRTAEQTTKTVKQSAHSSGKKTVKTVEKGAAKTTKKSVKTAEQTAKTAIKTSQQAAKAAQKTAQASAKAAQKAAQAAKATAKAVAQGIKAAVKATIVAVKAIIAGIQSLVAAIVAGGWIAVVVIIVICMIALLLSSMFGIFFSNEDSGTGMSMQTVVQEINDDYNSQLEAKKSAVSYDELEMSGSRAVWKDVLAVYAVKVNTDPDNPQEAATMDGTKKQLLKDIFWEMNEISSCTESRTETVITETDDGHGNIVQTKTTETKTVLFITVSHKTVDEMATQYSFTQEQKDYLCSLLEDKNNSMWSAVLFGIE